MAKVFKYLIVPCNTPPKSTKIESARERASDARGGVSLLTPKSENAANADVRGPPHDPDSSTPSGDPRIARTRTLKRDCACAGTLNRDYACAGT